MASEQTSQTEFIAQVIDQTTRATIQTMAAASTSRPNNVGPK